jgi:hypothetical protein
MLRTPRWLLALISISFGAWHALIGALAWQSYQNLSLLILAIVIFVSTLILSVAASNGLFIGPRYGAAVAAGAVATVVVASAGINLEHVDPYSTWYVGGMGVLLGVLAARGQARLAWAAAIAVAVTVYLEGGLGELGEVGLEGMLILIAAGQATSRSVIRADQEVEELQKSEILTQAAIISAKVSGDERRQRLQQVLKEALPALTSISSNDWNVDERGRTELMQLEARLRDDIRGRDLVNEEVRLATKSARERGVEVVLLDEGGLANLSQVELNNILGKVAKAISSVAAGKIVVRSPRGERWLVTVIATRSGTDAPDLWLKF